MRFDLGTVDALITTDLARDFRDIDSKSAESIDICSLFPQNP